MATRPNPFEKIQPETPMASGDLRSRLDKVLPKDVRISPDRKWAVELKNAIPMDLLEKATNFIQSAVPEFRAQRVQRLLTAIRGKSRGILGASDQEIALQDCIESVKDEERREIH